jgi:hypothetical protein
MFSQVGMHTCWILVVQWKIWEHRINDIYLSCLCARWGIVQFAKFLQMSLYHIPALQLLWLTSALAAFVEDLIEVILLSMKCIIAILLAKNRRFLSRILTYRVCRRKEKHAVVQEGNETRLTIETMLLVMLFCCNRTSITLSPIQEHRPKQLDTRHHTGLPVLRAVSLAIIF